jgi:hypothetical protein
LVGQARQTLGSLQKLAPVGNAPHFGEAILQHLVICAGGQGVLAMAFFGVEQRAQCQHPLLRSIERRAGRNFEWLAIAE